MECVKVEKVNLVDYLTKKYDCTISMLPDIIKNNTTNILCDLEKRNIYESTPRDCPFKRYHSNDTCSKTKCPKPKPIPVWPKNFTVLPAKTIEIPEDDSVYDINMPKKIYYINFIIMISNIFNYLVLLSNILLKHVECFILYL